MRLNWSFDGTQCYKINLSSTLRSGDLSETIKAILDGDRLQSSSDPLSGFNTYKGFAFSFPSGVTIEKIAIMANDTTSSLVVSVSSDSTDGLDGSWSTVYSGTGVTGGYVYQEFALTPTSGTWLRVYMPNISGPGYFRGIHLFGEYDSPRYEFWNAAGTAELTGDYPLSTASAPNSGDYAGNSQFQIKNADSVSHDYSLTVVAVRYGGDSVISSNYTLSTDGGTTKLTTVSVTGVSAGGFSGVIDLFADVLEADNPADGYHYFAIQVTEV